MSRADLMAAKLLSEHGFEEPPVDVHALAQELGVQVVESRLPTGVSGMLIREGSEATVGLTRTQGSARKRFTLAHELGHLHLHRGRPLIIDSAVRVNLRDATSAEATDREEMEANRFAAALLMPQDMMLALIRDRDTSDPDKLRRELAGIFDVSREAMGYRLINLGVTS